MRIVNIVLKFFGLITIKRAKIFTAELVSATARDIIHRVELGEHHGTLVNDVKGLYINSASKQFDQLLSEASTLDSKVQVLNEWEAG